MGFLLRRRLRAGLRGCDFNIAAEALRGTLGGGVLKADMVRLLEDFDQQRSLDSAVALCENYPDLVMIFEQAKPGGLYTRHGVGGPIQDVGGPGTT